MRTFTIAGVNWVITQTPPLGGSGRLADGVNEFYQKGCQEKSSASTGVEVVSRDPAHFPSASASLQRFCLLILISFSAYWWHCHRVERATSQWWLSVSTMVLSEARGLWLFLVIRGGITCNG